MKKMIVFGIAAVLAAGAFAEEEDGHVVLYGTNTGGFWSDTKWGDTRDGTKNKPWQDDAVGVFLSGNVNRPQKRRTSGSTRFAGKAAAALCFPARVGCSWGRAALNWLRT